jgi:hypothetical protein
MELVTALGIALVMGAVVYLLGTMLMRRPG